MARGNAQRALTTQHGRPAAYWERVRSRIDTSAIVNRVERCAKGEEEMTNVEFQAAKLLINKTIPDLPAPSADPLAGAKDISHANPHTLLTIIEGEAEQVGKE